MSTDDQLAALLAQNATLFAGYEIWMNAQIVLVTGTATDPDSFDASGGKTGALGYYPVTPLDGPTRYLPCYDRLHLIALQADVTAEVSANTAAIAAEVAVRTDQYNASSAELSDIFGALDALQAVTSGVAMWRWKQALQNRGRLQQLLDSDGIGDLLSAVGIRWSSNANVSSGDVVAAYTQAALGYDDATIAALFNEARAF